MGTYDPGLTLTVGTTLVNGGSVTCTFLNQRNSGTTRSPGFWATHESITNAAWFGGIAGGNSFVGVTDKTFCQPVTKNVTTIGEVLGGFWASISQTSTKTSRSALDQARMQLLQQLLAAILNNAAFGSAPAGMTISQAKSAYCGADQTAIQNALSAMTAFNTSGDTGAFSAGSSDATQAKSDANLAFWDVLP